METKASKAPLAAVSAWFTTNPRNAPVWPVPPADKATVCASAVASVAGAYVWEKRPAPLLIIKLELFCTVTAPLEVRPLLAVIRPEIVGVAVQAVGFTVKVVAALPKVVAGGVNVPQFRMPAASSVIAPLT